MKEGKRNEVLKTENLSGLHVSPQLKAALLILSGHPDSGNAKAAALEIIQEEADKFYSEVHSTQKPFNAEIGGGGSSWAVTSLIEKP